MKYMTFVLLISTSLISPLYANCDPKDTCQDSPTVFDTEEGESGLVRAIIRRLHTDFRAAILYSDYYVACLNNDKKWFANNDLPLRMRQQFCRPQLAGMKKGIKARFKKMRQLIGLSQHVAMSDSHGKITEQAATTIKTPEFDPAKPYYHYSVEKNIKHEFDETAELKPLSNKELFEAELIRINDLKVRAKWKANTATPKELKESYCAKDGQDDYIPLGYYDCYRRAYYEQFIGNKETGVRALPILAHVTSEIPNFHELTIGIEKIKENAVQYLADLESRFFVVNPDGSAYLKADADYALDNNLEIFFFAHVVERSIEGSADEYGPNPRWVFLYEIIKERLKKQASNQMWLQIGGMVAWGISCGIIFKKLITAGLCELPVGLFANLFFYVHDTENFDKAVKAAFYRADGVRSLGIQPNNLSDFRFSKVLSAAMVPLFTGIPKVIKGVQELRLPPSVPK